MKSWFGPIFCSSRIWKFCNNCRRIGNTGVAFAHEVLCSDTGTWRVIPGKTFRCLVCHLQQSQKKWWQKGCLSIMFLLVPTQAHDRWSRDKQPAVWCANLIRQNCHTHRKIVLLLAFARNYIGILNYEILCLRTAKFSNSYNPKFLRTVQF